MLKIAVFVSGSGTNLQSIIDSIDDGRMNNAKIKAVISDNPNAYALTRASTYGIETKIISPKEYSSIEVYSRELLEVLKAHDIELIVLAGYLKIIPRQIVVSYPNRIINIHPSLIPAFCGAGYYGLKVHEAVLQRGVKITGATVHFVDEGTDTGPIILQKAVHVSDKDTSETLQRRVMEEAEWSILPKAIDLIANNKLQVVDNKVILLDSM